MAGWHPIFGGLLAAQVADLIGVVGGDAAQAYRPCAHFVNAFLPFVAPRLQHALLSQTLQPHNFVPFQVKE